MQNRQLLSFLKLPQVKVYATINGFKSEVVKTQLAQHLRTLLKEGKAEAVFPASKFDGEKYEITLN